MAHGYMQNLFIKNKLCIVLNYTYNRNYFFCFRGNLKNFVYLKHLELHRYTPCTPFTAFTLAVSYWMIRSISWMSWMNGNWKWRNVKIWDWNILSSSLNTKEKNGNSEAVEIIKKRRFSKNTLACYKIVEELNIMWILNGDGENVFVM